MGNFWETPWYVDISLPVGKFSMGMAMVVAVVVVWPGNGDVKSCLGAGNGHGWMSQMAMG